MNLKIFWQKNNLWSAVKFRIRLKEIINFNFVNLYKQSLNMTNIKLIKKNIFFVDLKKFNLISFIICTYLFDFDTLKITYIM